MGKKVNEVLEQSISTPLEEEIADKINKLFKWVAIMFGGAVLLYSAWFMFLEQSLSTNTADWGTFGDFIGGLTNPMISLAALYVLANSFLLQKKRAVRNTISHSVPS